MIVGTIILVLILLLVPILVVPLVLNIDTDSGDYSLKFGWLFRGRITFIRGSPMACLRIGWWTREWDLITALAKTREPEAKKQFSKHRGKLSWGKALRLLNSFRIKKWEVDLDTNDYILNAKLMPLVYYLGRGKGIWRVNFNNKCRLSCIVENRLINVLYAIWK